MKRPVTVSEEIRQSRPFPTLGAEALVTLLRTAHVVHRGLEAVAQREGITLQQYNVLRILRGARGPLQTMEIAERLVEPAPGITRFVTQLEELGLIRREQWQGDRRCTLCQITPAGLALLRRLDEPMNQFDHGVLGGLTETKARALIRHLDEIRAAAHQFESAATGS